MYKFLKGFFMLELNIYTIINIFDNIYYNISFVLYG